MRVIENDGGMSQRMSDSFRNEAEFEDALIHLLTESCGWEKDVLEYPSEKDLVENWAHILYENNRSIDKLNDYPLTDTEMQQILDQIKSLRTPHRLNGFINGRTVPIKRDNPDDKAHFGKEVSLKIYDRQEIAAGKSRYQIAKQPRFKARDTILPDRRGDFMLLINGMPVIHVELKASGIPISRATYQIEKYSHEGVFNGIFALVQIFVAMNPEDAVYFANPGSDGIFNPSFYFHWADFYNNPVNDWRSIADKLLSIPPAHQMIGVYTVADDTEGVLKVMRSYQIYAVREISDAVATHDWDTMNQRGGYIWHTTGSGKTITSFKAAQLIANSKDADKVVFIIDRIELGTQSTLEYRGFAEETDYINETEDTDVLIGKLKSPESSDTLIVTSIQKMSNIRADERGRQNQADLELMQGKRIVFIVDECHRSSFGDMMRSIKETFPRALFFGFTGTPIQTENEKKGCTTSDVFGNELHRYSIADGIRDGNVLGFDPTMVLTYREQDERKAVALDKAGAKTEEEAFANPKKKKKFFEYMNTVPMVGHKDEKGNYHYGIEDYLMERGQYSDDVHHRKVVEDILDNRSIISYGGKFHAIFATSSIPEACAYYDMFREKAPTLKVTALFDPTIDDTDGNVIKEDSLIKIIKDYNEFYDHKFTMRTWSSMKKDIQHRLSHKKPYEHIENNPGEQLDLLIVVDQMLTGFDSKWVNALYLDKILRYENIIQAFSRTNRLYRKEEKPFGVIRYYRAPHTMKRNIDAAVRLYSEDKPLDLFVVKLDQNLINMNAVYSQIKNLFHMAGIEDFRQLPEDVSERRKFAALFNSFNEYLAAAKVQGFAWNTLTYSFDRDGEACRITVDLDEKTYMVLVRRYKELSSGGGDRGGSEPYDIKGYITAFDTEDIDVKYMNARFEKYRQSLDVGDEALRETVKEELHRSFATLSREDQRCADLFLHDIEAGKVEFVAGRTFRDYINEYAAADRSIRIDRVCDGLGVDRSLLVELMGLRLNESNINEFGRFDRLKNTVDILKASKYFEKQEGKKLPVPKVRIRSEKLLMDFIINGRLL